MRLLVLAIALQVYLSADSSLVWSAPSNSLVLKVPPVWPYTALGDYRVEVRLHNWTPPTGAAAYISWGSLFGSERYLELHMKPTGEICAYNWVDAMATWGNSSCANILGHPDVLIRVQRFGNRYPSRPGAVGSFLLEAQDVTGAPIASYCSSSPKANYSCPIDAARVRNWSVVKGYIGNPRVPTMFSLAWLKWFSQTVEPGSPFSGERIAADLADFRFDGNLTDRHSAMNSLTIDPPKTLPQYRATPSYAPVCVITPTATFRAGVQ